MKSFNVILTTINRPTLERMINSIKDQLTEIDYLTIIVDIGPARPDLTSGCKATVMWITNSKTLGGHGHGSRTKWQRFLPGDYHMNGDDDDVYTEDAMAKVREACTEDKLYIFKMKFGEREIWEDRKLRYANIGTPCGVYPPINLPDWPLEYGGDFKFYEQMSKNIGIAFCDSIIYKIKDA
jgi:hypothetical protein